jgi:hypothetical protein
MRTNTWSDGHFSRRLHYSYLAGQTDDKRRISRDGDARVWNGRNEREGKMGIGVFSVVVSVGSVAQIVIYVGLVWTPFRSLSGLQARGFAWEVLRSF